MSENKWTTGQSCIRKRSTTCKIGTLDPWGHDQQAHQGNNFKKYRYGKEGCQKFRKRKSRFYGCPLPPRWIWKWSWRKKIGKKVSLAQCCTSLLTSLLMRVFLSIEKKLGLTKKEWRPLSFRVRGHFARLVTLDKSPILLKRESVGQHSCPSALYTVTLYSPSLPKRIYNPITAMGFLAMFTFQLDNIKR